MDKLPEGVKDGLDIHRHVLPAAGGASGAIKLMQAALILLAESGQSALPLQVHETPAPLLAFAGVAESVVCFCKEKGADLVVVGSRGMGAIKSALMSIRGLGSVSSEHGAS